MNSYLDEDRQFFLEVIDDLARMAARDEHLAQASPEQWAQWERETEEITNELRRNPPAPEQEQENTPESFKEQMSNMRDEELLHYRRFTAQRICKHLVNVGRLHTVPFRDSVEQAVARLQMADAEISRRHLARYQAPRE